MESEGAECLHRARMEIRAGRGIGGEICSVAGRMVRGGLGQHVITVSSCELNLARRFGIASASEVTLIYNGISDCHRRFRNDIRPEDENGHGGAIRSSERSALGYARAARTTAQVRLTFVGDGPTLTQMQGQAIELGVKTA